MILTLTSSSSSSSSFSSSFRIHPKTFLILSPSFTPIFYASPNCKKNESNFARAFSVSQTKSKWVLRNNDPTVVITSSSSSTGDGLDSAANVVRKFYAGINRHDLAAVGPLIAQNCVYEDLIFPQPFVGREAILEFFKKFTNSVSTDLQFVIDDISEEDTSAVGVTWHLEWKGKTFPFSKGCSFYRLEVVNGQRQVIYGRDSVEPAIKPGETALVAIRGVAWLLQQFPQLADFL